ncbi:MAG: MFS transporter [Oscillospiraceae bacterium]|nr:MFS transporter [Oscillospiraceae bacterium]
MVTLLLAVIYAAFISLGLPDPLLGAAWPIMHGELGVPLAFSGGIFTIISAGTIVSSLASDALTRRFGPGRVTAFSVALTCVALFGFSCCHHYGALLLWAVPYGLGAGGVDAALNNYVALHYASRHMSWLHCMWGVGTAIGPAILARALSLGRGWQGGYRAIGWLQLGLTAILLLSLPLWRAAPAAESGDSRPMPLGQVAALPGVKAAVACFFCYCALEQTAGLWASSYLVACRGLEAVTAARWASLFYLGITAGRAVNGFLTLRLKDTALIRLGSAMMAAGLGLLLLPLPRWAAFAGLILLGLGCAPVYPSLIHAAPIRFGAERSQAVIGLQMATAYLGTTLMPPLFGLLAARATLALFPWYMAALFAAMALLHRSLVQKTGPV